MFDEEIRRLNQCSGLMHILTTAVMLMVLLADPSLAQDAEKNVENNTALDEIQASIEAF